MASFTGKTLHHQPTTPLPTSHSQPTTNPQPHTVLPTTAPPSHTVLPTTNPPSHTGCTLPSSPKLHPVGVYRQSWLNLQKQSMLSDVFWFMVYGSTHNMEACGLRAGLLYRVSRYNSTTFSFQENDDAPDTPCKDEKFMVLEEGSYGFVSCDESKLMEVLS